MTSSICLSGLNAPLSLRLGESIGYSMSTLGYHCYNVLKNAFLPIILYSANGTTTHPVSYLPKFRVISNVSSLLKTKPGFFLKIISSFLYV